MMPQRGPVPQGSLGMHTLSHRMQRTSGAHSPPLPPPPPPEDEHEGFGRPRTSGVQPIVPDEEDLPGWVPKNYIEKGSYYNTCDVRENSSVLFQSLPFMIIMRIKTTS